MTFNEKCKALEQIISEFSFCRLGNYIGHSIEYKTNLIAIIYSDDNDRNFNAKVIDFNEMNKWVINAEQNHAGFAFDNREVWNEFIGDIKNLSTPILPNVTQVT